MRLRLFIVAVYLFTTIGRAEPTSIKPQSVRFRSGDRTLNGCVYHPTGKGPFPAVIFNQSATRPSYEKIDWPPFLALAQFFTTNGYVFFIPGRYNHEGLEGSATNGDIRKAQNWSLETEARNSDVLAGITWLKAQSYVDENRIVLCGHSAGAIQALLVAEKKPEVCGTIAFSVGAISWKGSTFLQKTLQRAVKNTDTPILILQPQNDYSIESTRVLGNILREKPRPNRSKIFPPFGATQAEANLFGLNGAPVWGPDVLDFLKEITK
jgi:carboxymethylenebutenolidase